MKNAQILPSNFEMFKAGVSTRIQSARNSNLVPQGAYSKKLTRTQAKQMAAAQETSSTKDKLKFSLFLKTVLDFQLREHEKFLAPFAEHFRAMDSNNDGVVDEREFRLLMKRLSNVIPAKFVEKYLQEIDPFNN